VPALINIGFRVARAASCARAFVFSFALVFGATLAKYDSKHSSIAASAHGRYWHQADMMIGRVEVRFDPTPDIAIEL
jgi:hypothetical protein